MYTPTTDNLYIFIFKLEIYNFFYVFVANKYANANMIRSIDWGKLTPLVRDSVKINCN
jgi:hypothetical protein